MNPFVLALQTAVNLTSTYPLFYQQSLSQVLMLCIFGVGFLAENPEFAEIVAAHGLTFVGPKPEHIRSMGDKIEAKVTASKAGLPLVPGSPGAINSIEEAKIIAEQIGFPLLVKAASGGGGRGMKVAENSASLEEAFSSARTEAKAAFGDDTVYFERYLGTPRHIEVQVIADSTVTWFIWENENALFNVVIKNFLRRHPHQH